jgi:hypothetical protein
MDWSSLFGPTLVQREGGPVPTSELDGKYVFVYFSAHWCPPCRMFTPLLAVRCVFASLFFFFSSSLQTQVCVEV